MRNISFDNPYWLLIALPLLAVMLIPYFISVSKDNRTKGWIASLILHIIIVVSIALAAAGMVHTTVMTRTKVYIVADVSYSSNRNLDKIDEYIQQVEKNLPQKSYMGIVCFGNDCEILTSSGQEIRSVKESTVDDSGTDIAGALNYTATLFSKDEIKRIILITDGFSTDSDGSTVAAVRNLEAKGIRLDAVYLDNNLHQGESEAQISGVQFTSSTYLGHENSLQVLMESSVDNDIILDLYVRGEGESNYRKIDTTSLRAGIGMNTASFKLPSDSSGVFDYKVVMSPSRDRSPYNNEYIFTQKVAGQRNILLVTEKRQDVSSIESIYGESAVIDSYVVSNQNGRIPYTIEDLVKYDEIILSNVDIKKIDNIYAFIDSVDLAVSQYGKSLITLGDLYMQNKDKDDESSKENEIYARLEELLPISFGNANKDAKLYTIVIDISRSMYYSRPAQLIIAKDAATKLVSILDDNDTVSLVTLAGEAKIELPPTKLGECREKLYTIIQNVQPTQGTFIGEALNLAYENIKNLPFEEKQVMLISDGKYFKGEPEDAMKVAEKMRNDNIVLSSISVLNHPVQYPNDHTEGCEYLRALAEIGEGNYYDLLDETKVSELIFSEIADELTESVVEKQTKVNIESFRDETVEGILTLPDIYGYINSKAKVDATMVLSVDYQRENDVVKVPLYSYRGHGNGRVASFTSSLSNNWLRGWTNTVKSDLFVNILTTNTPTEKIDYPFNITVENYGETAGVEIIPSSVNPKAKAKIKLTSPDGSVLEREMTFLLNKYTAEFDTPDIGRYDIEITYTYGNHSFTSNSFFTVAYSREYDSFAAYDIVNLYSFMRGVGGIYKDGNINLQNDKSEIDTYELSFREPLLIFAIALFVVDVIIRKFRLKDIKGLFTKIKKEGAK